MKTVVEHIRGMTDEEFALFLVEDGWGCHNCSEYGRLSDNPLMRKERCDEDCEKHCLEWLHSKM